MNCTSLSEDAQSILPAAPKLNVHPARARTATCNHLMAQEATKVIDTQPILSTIQGTIARCDGCVQHKLVSLRDFQNCYTRYLVAHLWDKRRPAGDSIQDPLRGKPFFTGFALHRQQPARFLKEVTLNLEGKL